MKSFPVPVVQGMGKLQAMGQEPRVNGSWLKPHRSFHDIFQ